MKSVKTIRELKM